MSDPEYIIYVVNEVPYDVDEEAIRIAAWCALEAAESGWPVEMTVNLTTSEHVHELNYEYAGVDGPTDVLTFPSDPDAAEPDAPPYLGDVLIAVPVAEEQAADGDNALILELQKLAIHGTLHLMGFDHETPEGKSEMWAYESVAMDRVRSLYGSA
ncbi:MAG: rRNA maturation RNase YbeY [Chloroflexi bacterium]|nr:rRNA maturation RNase YbeY [Chloroflexota bacterium]